MGTGALDQLRNGDVPTAFAAYLEHGRVVIADDPDDLHAIVLGDWNTTRTTGATLLLAGTRAEARVLNRYARDILAANGELDLAHQIEIAGRHYAIGDHVVLCRNDPRQHLASGKTFAVDNGMRGTITDVSSDCMSITTTSGEQIVIDRDYLDHGWVDHAYAITIHKAQGVTCDHVLVVGPAGLYREGAYVALSRARDTAHLYVTTQDAAGLDERHQHGIPLPTEQLPDPQAELIARLQQSAAKNLVTIDDRDARRVAELVEHVPAPELLHRARHATAAEHDCGLQDPSVLRAQLDAATRLRHHIDIGRRIRAVDRDNVGHVIAIDDIAGTCTAHFENSDGRTAIKILDWAELVAIDDPSEVVIPIAAANTLDRHATAVELAEQNWADALAVYGVQAGDAALYRRAVHTSADQAARQLQADPPDWLTTWLGQRPVTSAGAAVWDDATSRIAHYRLLQNIDTEPSIGHRPTDPLQADRWNDLMLRLLEDRLWLVHHPSPAVQPVATCTPNELVDRRQELEQLLATAPVDQRQFIERIVHSHLDTTEMHDYLSTAMAVQDERREWIIANWPYIVELEQVTQLITAQEPLAHWPTAQPDAVRDVLGQLRVLAPELDQREDRSLAELVRHAAECDPVRQLESRRDHLQRLAGQTVSPDEQEALRCELASLRTELRQARRNQTIEHAFDRYLPNALDEARATRIATLAFDTLTSQPSWVIEYVRDLYDNHQLAGSATIEVATQIVQAAAHRDLGGALPDTWPASAPVAVEPAAIGIELG